MSEEKRIKHSVDLVNGTVAYSLGTVAHKMSLAKDFGAPAKGMTGQLATSAVYRLLVDACSGGDIEATHNLMIEAAKQIKQGNPIPLLPWSERKLVMAMMFFMQELGKKDATLTDAYAKVGEASAKPGKPKTVNAVSTPQTVWDNLQDVAAFRALIPKKEAVAPKAPDAALLSALGI